MKTSVASDMGLGCAEKSRELAFYYKKTASINGTQFLDAGKIPGIKMHTNDYMHLTKESHALLAITLAELILEH